MVKIDRLDFPKKYPIPAGIKLGVFLVLILGVIIHRCVQNQLKSEIKISNIEITEFSRVHVEVQYTVTNNSRSERDVRLLLKVFDDKGEVIGSSLFMVKVQPKSSQRFVKIIDKLERTLELSEKPTRAEIEVYTRKLL